MITYSQSLLSESGSQWVSIDQTSTFLLTVFLRFWKCIFTIWEDVILWYCQIYFFDYEACSQSPLSDVGRQDRPQQWAALNQTSNPVQCGGYLSATVVQCNEQCAVYLSAVLQCTVNGVNLIGIPGSLAARTSVSPLSSKAPTRNTRRKFKRNTTTREGEIHKYQNTGRWKTEIHTNIRLYKVS